MAFRHRTRVIQTVSKPLMLLLVDIVGFSKEAGPRQLELVESVLETWKALDPRSVPELLQPPQAPISIGDGFIFCGEDSLGVLNIFFDFVFEERRKQRDLASRHQASYATRFALHAGECFVITNNVIGHPMNELFRIAACALPNQLLVSKAFWDRIEVHFDQYEDQVHFPPHRLFYDEYLVRYKHDNWIISGRELALRQGDEDHRTIRNVIIPSADVECGEYLVGNRSIPRNVLHFTSRNNYHHIWLPNGTRYQLRSEEELFRYHCKRDSPVAAVCTGATFLRLPFTILCKAKCQAPPLIVEVIKQAPANQGCLTSLRHFSAMKEPEEMFILHVGQCSQEQYLKTNLSPDWCPNEGPYSRATPLRESLMAAPGLLQFGTDQIANAIRVSALVMSSDKCLLATLERSATSVRGEAQLNLHVSGLVEWKCTQAVTRDDDALGILADSSLQRLLAGPPEPMPPEPISIGRAVPRRDPVSIDRAVLRVVTQQVGIRPSQINQLHFLGIVRDHLLLGAPTAFYLVETNVELSQVLEVLRASHPECISQETENASLQLRGDRSAQWPYQLETTLLTYPFEPLSKVGLALLASYLQSK